MGVVVSVTILKMRTYGSVNLLQLLLVFPIHFQLFRASCEAGNKRGGYVIHALGDDGQERRHLCIVHSVIHVCFSVSFSLFSSK